jgi:hypothetical protein
MSWSAAQLPAERSRRGAVRQQSFHLVLPGHGVPFGNTGQHAAPLVVTGAVPQTATMLVATKRYSPSLVNFAAHSGTRSPTRQNTLFCAPSTNHTEGIVPVQNEQLSGYSRGCRRHHCSCWLRPVTE